MAKDLTANFKATVNNQTDATETRFQTMDSVAGKTPAEIDDKAQDQNAVKTEDAVPASNGGETAGGKKPGARRSMKAKQPDQTVRGTKPTVKG